MIKPKFSYYFNICVTIYFLFWNLLEFLFGLKWCCIFCDIRQPYGRFFSIPFKKKRTLLWANDMGTHKVVEFHCLSWFVTIMSATRFFFLNWCNGSNHCYAWQGSWVIYFTSWIMQYRGFARIWSMGRDPWGPAESWILVSARNTPSSSVHG